MVKKVKEFDTGNTPKEFSVRQHKAIELLAAGDMTYTQIADTLKIARSTLHQWRQMRDFMDAVIQRARELIREALPELYNAAIREAKAGKHAYFKTLLEHVDRLEQMANETKERHIVFVWDGEQDAAESD